MNDAAREPLRKLISSYGPAMCNTPRSCEMFLNQYLSDYKDEARVLVQALQKGTVSHLMAFRPGQQSYQAVAAQLAGDLTQGTGVSDVDAAWAVETWALAIGKHPTSNAVVAAPKAAIEPSQQVGEAPRASDFVQRLVFVTGAGGIGGFLGAGLITLVLALFIVGGTSFFQDDPELEGAHETAQVLSGLLVVIVALVGAAGGAVGAGGGWMLIAAQSSTSPGKAALAALSGALLGGAIGGRVGGLPGTGIGAFIGGFSGALGGGFGGK